MQIINGLVIYEDRVPPESLNPCCMAQSMCVSLSFFSFFHFFFLIDFFMSPHALSLATLFVSLPQGAPSRQGPSPQWTRCLCSPSQPTGITLWRPGALCWCWSPSSWPWCSTTTGSAMRPRRLITPSPTKPPTTPTGLLWRSSPP